MVEFRVLSIDAWRDIEGGWEWNNQYSAGTVEFKTEYPTNRQILKVLRDEGFLTDYSKGRIKINRFDDYYYPAYEICEKGTGEPIFCVEVLPE